MKKQGTFSRLMRELHRDIGFLLIGLIMIYAISGIVLTYRDTNFLKRDVTVEKKLEPDINPAELGRILHIRDLKITGSSGELIQFQQGTYNKKTGEVIYASKEFPLILSKFIELHKSTSSNPSHWFSTLFGILLLFLAISSFWMVKKGTRLFRRGVYISAFGIVISIAIILFST